MTYSTLVASLVDPLCVEGTQLGRPSQRTRRRRSKVWGSSILIPHSGRIPPGLLTSRHRHGEAAWPQGKHMDCSEAPISAAFLLPCPPQVPLGISPARAVRGRCRLSYHSPGLVPPPHLCLPLFLCRLVHPERRVEARSRAFYQMPSTHRTLLSRVGRWLLLSGSAMKAYHRHRRRSRPGRISRRPLVNLPDHMS